ncbi:MAG: hypothetical protein KY452_02630 [Actinobacteria bacterium]|nr:hypothetical protein [Actinomycetota bacterium]
MVAVTTQYRCWACGQLSLAEEPNGSYEICPNCGWEDDLVQRQDPDYRGGANGASLREFRTALLEDAAVTAHRDAGHVHGRPTIAVRIPEWEPVDLDAGSLWFGARIDEGWYVGYRACAQNGHVDLWMKYWEYGEDEPDFPPGAC